MTPEDLMSELLYISYATQVDAGMTHERAAKLYSLSKEKARKFQIFYDFEEFGNINVN